MSLIVGPLYRGDPTIKPQQWGPFSAVQSALFHNLERMGIDPASCQLALPMWGPGESQANYGLPENKCTLVGGAKYEKNAITFRDNSTDHILCKNINPSGLNNAFGMEYDAGAYSLYFYHVDGWSLGYPSGIDAFKNWASYAISFNSGTNAIKVYGNDKLVGEKSKSNTIDKTFICNAFSFESTKLDNHNRFYQFDYFGIQTDILVGSFVNVTTWPGSFNHALQFNYALSDSKVASLSDNPYQLWQPVPQKTIFLPIESGILPIELTANNISSTTSVGAPAIGQVHGLSATGVSSASSVGTPTISQKHTLTPTNISSTSSVGTPAIGQVHALTSTDIASATSVGSPAIGQKHTLTPTNISSTSSVGTPIITIPVDGVDNLTADGISSATSVGTPIIGQEHTLTSTDISSTSAVSSPVIGQVHDLIPASISTATAVGTPVIGQSHALSGENISSTTSVGSPVLAEDDTTDSLIATSISSATSVDTPAIGQVHALVSINISSAASVGTPRLNWVATITETPSIRTYSILFETRIYIIPARAPPYMVL